MLMQTCCPASARKHRRQDLARHTDWPCLPLPASSTSPDGEVLMQQGCRLERPASPWATKDSS